MRILTPFTLFFVLTAVAGQPPAPTARVAAPGSALLLREVRYTANLTDTQARFVVAIDAESFGKQESSATLFEGDVAVMPAKLPSGLRLTRAGNTYRLVAAHPGQYQFQLEVIAKITRAEPWNQVTFTGPAAGIASITATADNPDVDVQLLSGTPLDDAKGDAGRVRGVLGAERAVSLRWQSKTGDTARQALVTADLAATVQITPTVVGFTSRLHYEILQGRLSQLFVVLPANHALTRVEGDQIRDWQTRVDGDRQVLSVELIKPVERTYDLKLFSEQTVDQTPSAARLTLPEPQGVDRESGLLTVLTEDTAVEAEPAASLRQVDAPGGALAAYRFYSRPVTLDVKVRRIEPVINVAGRVSSRLEETRLVVSHAMTLKVERAGIYAVELSPLDGFTVTDVRGEGIEDWAVRGGRLQVSFSSRVLGERALAVQLEQTEKTFPSQIAVTPLKVAGATRQTTQIGAASAPGIRLKTGELVGLREIPIGNLANRTDDLLAYVADQPDWSLTLAAEKLVPRIVADVFNLVTIGDGLVGGSATIRYVIANQGVQDFRVQIPAHWKNVEFTGPNLRRKEPLAAAPNSGDTNSVVWNIGLQDKAWGGYTLVVTYDEQFDPHQATLSLGGLHALDAERETGSLAVTCAASLQLREAKATGPLQRIDEAELARTDRAVITRTVLLAYRYGASDPYQLNVDVTRFQELPVLEAVADRTQLTTVLTEAGQMLTQASFLVKNNDKQFQRFTLPNGAEFWSATVNGQAVKAERQAGVLLVPLPRGVDRDQAFAVNLVYAQNIGSLKSLRPQDLALAAPKTDVQTTFAEWELYVPVKYRLARFGGNMNVAPGTTYGLRDAWEEFCGTYREVLSNGALLIGLGGALLLAVLAVAAIRRGWQGAVAVAAALMVLAVLAGMLLPALAKAKAKSQRISAVNNLKQVGLALRLHADQNQGRLPASLEELKTEIGSERVLVDPQSGQRFEYRGAGKSNVSPDSVVAFAPADRNGNAVLLGDGSVVQMDREQFERATKGTAGDLMQLSARSEGIPRLADVDAKKPVELGLPVQEAAVAGSTYAAAVRGGSINGPAGPSPLGAPMAQGIRPIHIDIPRAGQRFVFTKVLNVGDELLKIEAWAITATVWNALRGGLQAALFLGGLALLWRQLRRADPRTFLVAVALALVLGSVASLLIVTRYLGMALILAAPLFALAALAYLAWRCARRPGETPPTLPAADATEPSAPHSTPGIGPAVASIALLLFVNSATAHEPAPVKAPARAPQLDAVSILSATYTGTVRQRVAEIDAVIQLFATSPGETIPLFGEDVAVESFTATPRDVTLLRQGNSISVRLPKKGEATVTIRFLTKLGGDVTRRRLGFGIPPALSSQLVLTVDAPEAAVEFPTAVAYHIVDARQQTRVEAVMGAGERVELQWTPRVKRAAEIAATVFCQNATLVSFGGGVMKMRSQLDYQITQGELRQARVRLPAGERLLRVIGDSIRTWRVGDDGASQVLMVELLKGIPLNYRLTLETERTVDRLPGTFAVATPHALELKRETGLIGLGASDELGLTVDAARGLQKVDAAEFQRAIAQTNALAAAYQFLKPDFTLNVRVETLQPQIEAAVRDRLMIGTDELQLAAQVDYTIKRAGVFALRLALPDGFRIESVNGRDITQWAEKTETAGRALEVTLKQRTLGNYTLQLQLVKSQAALPKAVEIVGVHPLGIAKLTGFVVVSAEVGVQARTASFTNLTEVPVASVPDGGTGLAYKFINNDPGPGRPSWKLTVATEAVEPWVRAEVVDWLTLGDALMNGRARVRYEIQNAPVKEFRLRIPAAFRNVDITGANIRRRDQNGEEWRVELQNRVVGVYFLTVTWEQPWTVKEHQESLLDALGVGAIGVERETGALAVVAKPELQIAAKTASSELVRIDPQELPEWAGNPDAATVLAYRYLRPGYKLSLGAQRFAPAEVLQALAESVRLTTVVADDGQMMSELELSVRNNGRQYLEIALPRGAQVWSAFVAGQAVRPSVRAGKLLLPIERTEDAAIPVEVIYVSAEKFPRTKGTVALESPALDVPAKNARWELYLPADYGYSQFTGTMTRDTGAAPVYSGFTLTEYSAAESRNKRARDLDALNSLDAARRTLSVGKLGEASKAYSQVRRFGGYSVNEEAKLKELEKDLRKAQSGNLLSAQQGVIMNNAAYFRQSTDQPAQQQALRFDEQAAEQQWAKLQQAQEVASVTVRPLRLNLPTRGLRQSFFQVLQTEVGKPMQIRFVASNRKAASWPTGFGLAAAGFAGLWGLVGLTFGQRKPAAPASGSSSRVPRRLQ